MQRTSRTLCLTTLLFAAGAALFFIPAGMYNDGTYQGSAFGYGGKTRLTVTISGGQIVEITQTNNDTPEFFNEAWNTIYPQIMANQTADGIDTVSGATLSSEGILGAAQKALAQAKK